MRLLIVEDSPLVRRMYGLAFSRRDHQLVEAENGQQALDILAASTSRFDLILLDLRMPGLDGVGFIRAVQGKPTFDVPIIVTTSEPESSPLLQQARGLRVAAIIKKPWKPQELADLVHSVLETWHP
jgi:CheY-like chemotaxis protein